MKKLLLAGACLLALSACQMNNQTGGALLGGAAGGLLGNTIGKGSGRTAAIVGGTLLGTFAGSQLGASMDRPRSVIVQQQPFVQQSQVPYNQWSTAECGHLTNPGVRSACERGIAERNRQRQRQAEQRAYRCGRTGRCN
jgi:predicted lipid-binding transport protein (Tim44 family)